MRAKRSQYRKERGVCSVCRRPVTVVVLSSTSKVAEQHGEAIQEGNLLGCRGSGAIALDLFAAGAS